MAIALPTAISSVGPKHEVVDQELRALSEEVCQRGASLAGLESTLLLDPNPRQHLPTPRKPGKLSCSGMRRVLSATRLSVNVTTGVDSLPLQVV
jgi:hypothetical protein